MLKSCRDLQNSHPGNFRVIQEKYKGKPVPLPGSGNSVRQQKNKILSQIYRGYYAASHTRPAFNPFPCDSIWLSWPTFTLQVPKQDSQRELLDILFFNQTKAETETFEFDTEESGAPLSYIFNAKNICFK